LVVGIAIGMVGAKSLKALWRKGKAPYPLGYGAF